jgi:hypothetical protein
MSANAIAALLGLLFSLLLAGWLLWETIDGLRRGRFLMRGPSVIERDKHAAQFYVSLVYKLSLIGISLIIAIYSGGRLAGLWGPV